MKVGDINATLELPIMESFYTIQGEGNYSGRAAYFIRLAGCDVGCVWCDVKESWNASDHPLLSIESLVQSTVDSGTRLCVITGGEPAMYDLSTLVNKLKSHGIEVAIETSGCYELSTKLDWYCFSPKKFKAPVEQAYSAANELKVIISHPSDFNWAEGHAKKVNDNCVLYLQPEWSKQERFLPLIIEYVKEHPNWRISLQTHKFMNIP
ncbi:MAG: 7-carboxy-7-deazaguanine synthase [Flavobacteriaceae bacterium]|jgi:7-carboxy-7-deazaguanine synthase